MAQHFWQQNAIQQFCLDWKSMFADVISFIQVILHHFCQSICCLKFSYFLGVLFVQEDVILVQLSNKSLQSEISKLSSAQY